VRVPSRLADVGVVAIMAPALAMGLSLFIIMGCLKA
jgi:hypothetical protein